MTLAYRAHAALDRLLARRSVLRLRENTAPEIRGSGKHAGVQPAQRASSA
jgi:hypothetical protein